MVTESPIVQTASVSSFISLVFIIAIVIYLFVTSRRKDLNDTDSKMNYTDTVDREITDDDFDDDDDRDQ